MKSTRSEAMSPEHKRVIFLEHGVGSALFNLVLNGAIAWAVFRGLEQIPLWGQRSIVGDTIGTCFFLPLCTALIVTPLLRRRLHSGELEALAPAWPGRLGLARLPSGTLARGAVLGGLCVALAAPVAVLAFRQLGVTGLALWPFVAFKALFAAALAALVTPLIAVAALSADR
jgi:hypothetical protein